MAHQRFVSILLIIFSLLPAASLCAQSATAVNESDSLTLYTFGLQNQFTERARRTVGREWGIGFRAVAGCIVPTGLADSVDRHNAEVSARIARRLGADWEARFEAEVEKELERQQRVFELMEDHDLFIARREALGENKHWLRFLMTPIPGTTTYDVMVYVWEPIDDRLQPVLVFQLQVDYETEVIRVTGTDTRILDVDMYDLQ